MTTLQSLPKFPGTKLMQGSPDLILASQMVLVISNDSIWNPPVQHQQLVNLEIHLIMHQLTS
jgi:hypothetical protein